MCDTFSHVATINPFSRSRAHKKSVTIQQQHTCLRLEPRGGLLELDGRSDSDVAGGISLRYTERDSVQPKSETDSDQSQFMRSRVLRSQCLRRRIVGTRRTLQGTSLQRFSSSRDGFRLGKTLSTAQGTMRTQTYRNTVPCNTSVDTRETVVGESSGHEERHCRSLQETSGWIATAVARKETWTSNPG